MSPTRPRTPRASGAAAAPSALRRLRAGAALAALALWAGAASAQSPAPAPLYGQSWALVVGIDKYDKVRPRLNYAVADARDIAAALPALGFPKENTRLLLDAQATKANIEQVLYREFAGMGTNDRLFVYFAGHGETADIKGGEEGYLLPVDADPKALPPTAISMDEVKRVGQRVRAKHVFFAIDACFSGFALTRDTVSQRGGDDYLIAVSRLPAVQVLTAGRKGEQAIEANGHGLFTRRLLDAFRGHADLEGRGYLTAAQLFSWVEQRVVRDSQGKMTPQYGKLDGEGQFIFTVPRIGGPVVTLAPAPTVRVEPRTDVGSLYVTATLPGIEVWLGDQRLGETAAGQALVVENLGAGRHQLRATKPGYREWRGEVSIAPKARTDARIELESTQPAARPGSEPPRVAALPREPPAPVPSGALARALGGDRASMVFVPAGPFFMGAAEDDPRATPAEKPQRTVTLGAYWIDQYEVTNAQWTAFRQAHGGGATALSRDPRFAGTRRPIVGVTWDQAQEYCKWAGKRLPTEAEWEKAARGTDGRAYPWGEATAGVPPAQVGKTETSDVGSHPRGASVYGALDMAGNVWEWVLDWYDPSVYKRVAAPTNPRGPTIGAEKVLRGGSWWERDPASARTTARHHQSPDRANNNVGFRCVLSGDDQLR